jgi:hypothetical protein
MEAKYNPETTDSSLNLPTFADLITRLASKVTEEEGIWKIRYNRWSSGNDSRAVTQTVSLPRLCTIETYDELIKYVEEMYVNGMILGDEFVMKPCEEQKEKLMYSRFLILYGEIRSPLVDMRGFYTRWRTLQKESFEITTSFGVKIIIK